MPVREAVGAVPEELPGAGRDVVVGAPSFDATSSNEGAASGNRDYSVDVEEVFAAAQRAVDRGRRGEGPTLLECRTFRWRGHVGPAWDMDVGVRRSNAWRPREMGSGNRESMSRQPRLSQ